MKAKIISILLVFATFLTLLTGCEFENTDNSSDTGINEVSPKEVLLNTLNNQYIKTLFGENYNGYEYVNLKGNAEIDDGEETAKLDYDMSLDLQQTLAKGDFSLSFLEEALKGNFVFDGESLFYSLPEVYDKAIKSFMDIPQEEPENQLELDYKIYTIVIEYMNAVSQNKFDDCFSSEKLDEIIIRNIQFKDEYLYTFAITDEKAKELLGDEYNQEINDFDISITVKYIEKNGKATAVLAEGFAKSTKNDQKEEYSFKLEFSDNGIDFEFSVDFGDINLKTTLIHNNVLNNQNGSFEMVISTPEITIDDENPSVELKAVAYINYKNGKGDFEFDFFADSNQNHISDEDESITKIKLPFEYGIDQEGRIYFFINAVEFKSTGVTVTMDISAKIYFKPINKGAEIALEFNYEIGEEKLFVSTDFTFTETEKFEINTPTDFITQEEATDLEDVLFENYPNILEFLGLFGYDSEGEVIWVKDSNGSAQHYFATDTQTGWITDDVWLDDDEEIKELLGFDFNELSFDKNGIASVDINGLTFECIKSGDSTYYPDYYLEYVDPKNPDLYFSLTYNPSIHNFYIDIGFMFTSIGNKYNLIFADGTVIEKTILFDTQNEIYYFEE